MRMHRSRVVDAARRAAIVAGVVLASACGDDGGGTGSASGTGSGSATSTSTGGASAGVSDGADETAGDGGPCPPRACATATDCCTGAQPNLPGIACPGPDYPVNWQCVDDVCVPPRCTPSSECLIPNFECRELDGIGYCVAPCTLDSQCTSTEFNMPGTLCQGRADDDSLYCIETVP